jgi:hypothetical protein
MKTKSTFCLSFLFIFGKFHYKNEKIILHVTYKIDVEIDPSLANTAYAQEGKHSIH